MDICFEEEKLKDILDKHMNNTGKKTTLCLLNKGLVANTYSYKSNEKKYLVKKSSQTLGSLEYEFWAMKNLNEKDFLPKVYEIIEKKILVEEYLYGGKFSLKQDYIELANVLSELHSYPLINSICKVYPNCVLELCNQIENFYSILKKQGFYDKDLVECLGKKINYLLSIKNEIEFDNCCILHNDLHSENIIMCEDRCKLIDWEQCKISNFEWDLAHAISYTTSIWSKEKGLSVLEKKKFITKYCENRKIPDVEECINRVFFVEKYVELRCILWAFVSQETIDDKEKINKYERRILDLKF